MTCQSWHRTYKDKMMSSTVFVTLEHISAWADFRIMTVRTQLAKSGQSHGELHRWPACVDCVLRKLYLTDRGEAALTGLWALLLWLHMISIWPSAACDRHPLFISATVPLTPQSEKSQFEWTLIWQIITIIEGLFFFKVFQTIDKHMCIWSCRFLLIYEL